MGARRSADPARERWEEAARAQLGKGVDEAGRVPIVVGPPDDPEGYYLEQLGFPGQFPYTRGIHPTMYRGRLWTSAQKAGYGDARETNRRLHDLLNSGQTGIAVAFDVPTQIGYDPDHPKARGEVGRAGVTISSLADMKALFGGIPLGETSVSISTNATAPILTAMLVAVGESNGVPRSELCGTVQNDVLGEYVAHGSYIFPPAASMRLSVDLVEFATREMPRWNFLSVSGYDMREAGATAVQEVAFTLANAIAYADAVRERGLDVDAFLSRLSFSFSADRDFLEEIAKFRAARRLWASIARDRFASKNPRSRQMRFHTRTALSSLSAQQPELNVIRSTLEALSATLGGTQSLDTNALDEVLGPPSEGSARLALRTQQILAEESGVPSTVDPLGGAYAIEELTDRIESGAEDYLSRIESLGGALAALDQGFCTGEIARAASRTALAREKKEEIVVGVNDFTGGNPMFSLFPGEVGPSRRVDRTVPGQETRQVERLRGWRRKRSEARVKTALDALRRSTEAGENVMAGVLRAVTAGATLGEVAGIWREIFGQYRPPRSA